MKRYTIFLALFLLVLSCQKKEAQLQTDQLTNAQQLTFKAAHKIIELPLHCIEVEYPNRLGQTLGSDADLKNPKVLRPIFYGCFDWHSSVHGYWSIVHLLKKFPELDQDGAIHKKLNAIITPDQVALEIAFFEDANNRNFERTYGWVWLFQLQRELLFWEDQDAQRWAQALEPLVALLVERYETYLPKLNYPIRTGTHDNSAFSLSLALDYARATNNAGFEKRIVEHSKRLFEADQNCNLAFEPSGHDFLSPCLEEARLMSKIYDFENYERWLQQFLPELFSSDFTLAVGRVSDRTDGHLVHLDGLNFSRTRCFKDIARKLPALQYLNQLATNHFEASFGNITNDDYMGSHWLGSFALYALLP